MAPRLLEAGAAAAAERILKSQNVYQASVWRVLPVLMDLGLPRKSGGGLMEN